MSEENKQQNTEAMQYETVLCAGDRHPHRYWECECCGQLITTMKQDDATKYQCPACKISECEHGGRFVEITLQDFCKNANIACT